MSTENLSDIKFQEVEALVRQYREERDEYDQLQKVADDAKKVLKNTESRIMAFLEQFNLKTQKTVYGSVTRVERFSVKTPKDDESRAAFREWLEGRGEFNNLWSVNSRTLDARAKEWLDEAADKGDIDFVIPGVGEPTYSSYLSFRRK